MATPYTNPDFDGTVNHDGTAYLFPVSKRMATDPNLIDAVNALFYDDAARWPTSYSLTSPYAAGTKIPLKTTLVDCPDACTVANWLAVNDADQAFLPGVLAPTLPVTDVGGTIPYVNPATSSDPDAVYALNYLIDNSGAF
jgi:hypothetical protein